MLKPIRYFQYNTGVLLIEWPKAKDINTLHAIQTTNTYLHSQFSNHIYETVPGYHSLMVYYNHKKVSSKSIETSISELENKTFHKKKSAHWDIPVNYNTSCGIDLEVLSHTLNLSIETIINLHTSVSYTIHFIGFLPGFLYLSGLSEQLNIPRRNTPRLHIPRGSVAIAGGQTGIYPVDSPGGWHIIGNTSLSLFDPNDQPPSRYNPGDTVRFINNKSS